MAQKEKIQLIITACLLMALFIIVKGQISASQPVPEPRVSPSTFTGVQGVLDPNISGSSELEEKLSEFARDPFVQSARPSVTKGPELNGIMWEENRSLAVVNKQIVEVGMVVDGYTVISITKQTVVLNDGQSDIVLQLRY